ncbi:MAG TPA: hypothetical protein VE153_06435, partial [Myxococcus sp.]|nr:hypothetical protein [Myxococcus sp.]
PPEEGSSVQWQLMAGGMSVLDGYDSLGHQGLLLASGWEFPSWRLRFQFLAGLPTLFQQDPRFEVRLWQYTVGMGFDLPVYRSGPLRWAVGGGVGLLVFARSSFSLSGGVAADNPRILPSLLVGPDTSVRWQLSRIFAAEATFALDVVAGRPILGLAENNSFQAFARGSAVRPRLGLVLMIAP